MSCLLRVRWCRDQWARSSVKCPKITQDRWELHTVSAVPLDLLAHNSEVVGLILFDWWFLRQIELHSFIFSYPYSSCDITRDCKLLIFSPIHFSEFFANIKSAIFATCPTAKKIGFTSFSIYLTINTSLQCNDDKQCIIMKIKSH